MTTSHTVVKIEYDPRVSSSVLDLTDIIDDILPKAREYDEDLRIEVIHRIESNNSDPHLTLKTQHLDLKSTKVEVLIRPSTPNRRDVMTYKSLIQNEMDPEISLIITGYRFKIFITGGNPRHLLTNRADSITDVEVVVESDSPIRIAHHKNTSSKLTVNKNALDLLKGKNNRIRSLEYLHQCVTERIDTPYSIELDSPSLIAGRVDSIDHSRFRVDSDVVFDSCLYGGVLTTVANMVHSTEVTINGNVRFENSMISGIMSGLAQNLSDSSLKVRGSVILSDRTTNVIGLMVGTTIGDISGDIKVDIRERVIIDSTDDEHRQFGIVTGMVQRRLDAPYTSYSKQTKMLYDLVFLENTFRRKTIEGRQVFRDVGTFSATDVDRAINSMVDFESSNTNTLRIRSKVDRPHSLDTMDKIEEVIRDQQTESRSGERSVENYGGIFMDNRHIPTVRNDRSESRSEARPEIFARTEMSQVEEISSIFEATRRAIRNKKGSNEKSRQSKSKQSKSKQSKSKRSKSRSRDRPYRIKKAKSTNTRYSKKKVSKKSNYSPYISDDPYLKPLYDRRSDYREINLHNPLPKRKTAEEEEEELFASINAKRSIEDRRLSKERQARENRLGRLKKSLHTFG